MEQRSANNSQDDQQVPNHSEEDDHCQRKNEQGLIINHAGDVSAHLRGIFQGKREMDTGLVSAGLMSSKKPFQVTSG